MRKSGGRRFMKFRKGILLGAAVALLGAGSLLSARDYQRLGFDTLAAKTYEPIAPDADKKKVVRDEEEYLKRHVLDSVLALDGKSVEIAGYMLPISVKGQKVDEFLLMPDTGACCYGNMPAFNEFVFARAKKGANLLDNIPIRIRGTFAVEEVRQSGFFSHLYYVEGEEVVAGFGSLPSEPIIGL